MAGRRARPDPPPIEVDGAAQPPLGMPAEAFLRDYMISFHQFISRVYTAIPRETR